MFKRSSILLLALCSVPWLSPATAAAESPGPGWRIDGMTVPGDLHPGETDGKINLLIYNIGGAPSRGGPTLTLTLPKGLTAEPGGPCTGESNLVCQLESISPSPDPLTVQVPVAVAGDAAGNATATATISGAGAPEPAVANIPVSYSPEPPTNGYNVYDAWFSNENGTIDTQAGSHPYEFSLVYGSKYASAQEESSGTPAGGEPRDVEFILPPGFVGNTLAVPQCKRYEFENEQCPPSSWVGEDFAAIGGNRPDFGFNVYNLVPPPGVAAQFAFTFNGIDTFLDARIRSGGDYGITTELDNTPQFQLGVNTLTLWGVPAQHNNSGYPPAAFMTMPTSCQGPQEWRLNERNTWQSAATKAEISFLTHFSDGTLTGNTGCERLTHFEPTMSIQPETRYADTPTGLSVSLHVPLGLNPEGLATSGMRDSQVTLPEGVVINPGQATGLVACGSAEENIGGEGEEFDGPSSCPAASKIGTDEIVMPILPDRLRGNVYILGAEPPHMQLLMTASADGVNVKLVGNIELNPVTGQLTTVFTNTPDAPVSDLTLNFSGGAQAALATPTQCGVYASTSELTPWAAPFIADSLSTSAFTITSGPGGTPCESPLPFAPTMTAGATTDQAGGYTSFSMLLQRPDGQQRVSRLQFKTPEGLLGMIGRVPLCSEAQANAGDCSAASQIGHTVVGAGPGPYPFFIPETNAPPAPIYLTGPYEGAPYGLAIVIPLVAGPFNLGTEVVRAKIEVDPITTALTITTDPLPVVVKGIPADMRTINALIDRPEFMFNPTSCAPMSFSGTAYSVEGATAPLESHFQMGSCRSLVFNPNFTVSTQAKTSRTEGASLTAKLVYPTGNLGANQATSQAAIRRIKVELPKQLPSRLTTLQKACTGAIFNANPAACPAASRIGDATAVTPILPEPLRGPAYFVSNGGAKFPELIIVLQSYGLTVDVHGETFISTKGITSTTFPTVPDVPYKSFELTLPEGPSSVLSANVNLCANASKLTMPTELIGQNGATIDKNTKISVTGCSAAKSKKHTQTKKAKKHKKHHKAKKGKKKG